MSLVSVMGLKSCTNGPPVFVQFVKFVAIFSPWLAHGSDRTGEHATSSKYFRVCRPAVAVAVRQVGMKREKDERHPSWACPPGLGTRYNSEKHRITITLDDGVSCYRCLLPASIDGVLLPSHTISTEWKAFILKLISRGSSRPGPEIGAALPKTIETTWRNL